LVGFFVVQQEGEMDLGILVRGMLLGFSIAAPVGPIGVLVIRHSVTSGRMAGLMTGLGAAAADALYGLIGGLGLSAISRVLVDHAGWLRIIGGAFMLLLGVRTFLAQPAIDAHGAHRGRARTFATGLLLTLSNPMTMLSFAAMFAGLGVGAGLGSGSGAVTLLVVGVFAGSAAWWLLLSGGASLARSRMTPSRLRWINRGSGLVIVGFGVLALVAAV
jgi:threonine/homoserine/homoserine lactone efflux protein